MSCCKKIGQELPREALNADAVQALAVAFRAGLVSIGLPELADLVAHLIEENARLRRALQPQPQPEPVSPSKPLPGQLSLPFSE